MNAYSFAPTQTLTTNDAAAVRTPLSKAPIVYKAQNAEHRQKCLNEIITDVRERNATTPEQVQNIIMRHIAMRRAFIQVFNPSGVFTHAFATIYRLAHHDAMPPAIALQEAQSYVVNRRDEQMSMLKEIENPAILNDVMQALASNYVPAPEATGIGTEKRKMLIDELVQLNGLMGNQPATHIHDTARGHVDGHIALAKTLDPQGPLASVLSGTLMPLAPHLQPEETAREAHNYLEHFQRLAMEVADALQPNGEIVQEAIRQSEAKRQSSGVILRETEETNIYSHPRQKPTTLVSWMQLLGSIFPSFASQSRA